MKKPAVVLYTIPAIGHVSPMIELGNLVATLCPSLAVATPPAQPFSGNPFISSTAPHITFHCLPVPSLPPDFSASSPSVEALILESLRLNNPDFRQYLESILGTHSVLALILDLFCMCAGPIARDLGIPFYLFGFALFLHLPILHDSRANDHGSEQDNNKLLNIPGLPPVSLLDLPKACLDCSSTVCQFFVESSRRVSSFTGVILNTFDVLEHRAVETARSGECWPGERIPIFCVGPLISSNNRGSHQSRVHECLTWLDGQPKGGVIFLCFGSMGVFAEEQLKEIATGLEMSSHRFLWVVRRPSEAGPDQGVASLLPEGFLERTEGRGMVVSSWVPQVDVLRHESVGGFVTHCGWNSVLEAVCAGVPMVTWPLYAEQMMNRVVMVEEIGIALRLEEDKEDGSVSAEELEKKVRMLMEGEKGAAVRAKTKAMKDAAAAAVEEGGTSRVALGELVESWKL